MKKKIAYLLLTGLLVGTMNGYAISDNQINANGTDVVLESALDRSTGSVMIALKDLAKVMEGQVVWDAATSKAVLATSETKYAFQNGSLTVTDSNGALIANMTAPAVIKDGRMFVPLNAAVDVFGKQIAVANDQYVISDLQGALSETTDVALLVEKALENSDTYTAAVLSVKQDEIIYDDAQDGLQNSFPYDTGNTAEEAVRFRAYQSYYSSGISLDLAELNLETQKLKVENAVLSDVETILLGASKQSDLEKQIAYSDKSLKQSELKNQLGLVSLTDIQTARLTHENLKESLEIQKAAIQKAWEDLNHSVGRTLTDRYNIKYTQAYTPYVGDLDTIYSKSVEESPDIFGLEKQIELAQNEVQYYVFNSGSTPYSAQKIDVTMAKIDLEKAKKGYKESIISYLNSIRSLELNRSQLLIQQQSAQLALDKVYKNYQVGMATELEYEAAQLTINSLKASIKEVEYTHNQTVRKVNALWAVN